MRGGAGGEVLRPLSLPSPSVPVSWLSRGVLSWPLVVAGGGAGLPAVEARQVADQQGSGAVVVEGGQEGEEKRALMDWVVHGLKGDLFPDLMEMMG
jgi:hypothetical protein